jgi:hypothetical protein
MSYWTVINEQAALLFIVFLVYLLQCISWGPSDAIVFTLGVRGLGRRRHPGFVWNAFNVAGILANPFPPLTALLTMQWPSFELSRDFLLSRNKNGEPVSIPWENLKVTSSDSKLFCNGLPILNGDEGQMLRYAELLERLRDASVNRRDEMIQAWLYKAMNSQAASRRLRIFSGRSFRLRIIANLQFLFLFLVLPFVVEEFGAGIFRYIIVILIAISVIIAIEFCTLHKRLLPREKEQRFKSAVTILLSPIAAIRACDAAARDLLIDYHPVAAAAALPTTQEFMDFAGEQLRLCRFGDYLNGQYQAMLQKQMERTFLRHRIEPKTLLYPSQKQRECVVFCPRCLAQYTKARESCSDCGYQGLTEWAKRNAI